MTIKVWLCGLLMCGVATASAQEISSDQVVAASEDIGWKFERYSGSIDWKGSASKDFDYTGVRVSTNDPSVPQLTISCTKPSGMAVTFFMQAIDDKNPDERARRSKKYRSVKAALKVGDDRAEMMPFSFVRSDNIFQSQKQKTAARVYNAIVSGKPITFKNEAFPYPPMDEAFKQFARECYKT